MIQEGAKKRYAIQWPVCLGPAIPFNVFFNKKKIEQFYFFLLYKVLIRITEADRSQFILCFLALLGNSTLVIHGLGSRFIFYVCFRSLYSKQ